MEIHNNNLTFHKRGSGKITLMSNHNADKSGPNVDSTDSKNTLKVGNWTSTNIDPAWYTRPLRISRSNNVVESSSKASESIPPARPSSPASSEETIATESQSGRKVADNDKLATQTLKVDKHCDRTISSMDKLAREFFPLTLCAKNDCYKPFNSRLNPIDQIVPVPKVLPPADTTPWRLLSPTGKSSVRTKARPSSCHSSSSSKSRSRRSRPDSAHSSSSSASKNSLDRMFVLANEAPVTAGACAVLLSSPYTSELARLRMDRLRIEEEHLLEIKRQEELEKIRGPQPKWYELKTKQFHYEAHKNNDLLGNEPNWQAMMDYRIELEKASKNFQKIYTSAATSSS